MYLFLVDFEENLSFGQTVETLLSRADYSLKWTIHVKLACCSLFLTGNQALPFCRKDWSKCREESNRGREREALVRKALVQTTCMFACCLKTTFIACIRCLVWTKSYSLSALWNNPSEIVLFCFYIIGN